MAPAEGACAPLNPAFVAQMEALLGAEAPAFCAALEAPAALALRVNPARPAAGELRPLFARDPVPWAENGYYLLPGARPGAGLSHFCGAFYVQEASAMLPAALLDVRPGQRVLDLCAAPGGKSSQLAAALGGEGLLISNEPEPKRAKVLAGNLERLGVPNAIVVNEYPEKLARKWPGFFDAVLVDAPCSGEGMFRREPDSRAQWQPNSPAWLRQTSGQASWTGRRSCCAPAAGWCIPPAPTTPRKMRKPWPPFWPATRNFPRGISPCPAFPPSPPASGRFIPTGCGATASLPPCC